MSVTLSTLLQAQLKQGKVKLLEGNLLALDPGETTGYCIFNPQGVLIAQGQERTWPLESCIPVISKLLEAYQPKAVVFESYQVYSWKTEDHSWSQIPTVQVIGCVKTLIILANISYFQQTAQVAKQFVSDQRLKDWNMWFVGIRHARDAIRHACYFLLFGPKNSS